MQEVLRQIAERVAQSGTVPSRTDCPSCEAQAELHWAVFCNLMGEETVTMGLTCRRCGFAAELDGVPGIPSDLVTGAKKDLGDRR